MSVWEGTEDMNTESTWWPESCFHYCLCKQCINCVRNNFFSFLNASAACFRNIFFSFLNASAEMVKKRVMMTPTCPTDSAGFLSLSVLIGSWWAALWGCTTLWAEVARRTWQSCSHSLTRRTPIAYQVTRDKKQWSVKGWKGGWSFNKCSKDPYFYQLLFHQLAETTSFLTLMIYETMYGLTLGAGSSWWPETFSTTVEPCGTGLTASLTC